MAKLMQRVFFTTFRCGCGKTYGKHERPGRGDWQEEEPVESLCCMGFKALPFSCEEVEEKNLTWNLVVSVYGLNPHEQQHDRSV